MNKPQGANLLLATALALAAVSTPVCGAPHTGPLITTPANRIFPPLDTCDDGVFCNGIERLRGNGTCYVPNKNPCDDGDDCTRDICSEDSMTCTYEVLEGCAFCEATCTPDCSGKVCGEDGCAGFCGTCPAGLGCLNGECVQSASDGTCAAPLFLLGRTNVSNSLARSGPLDTVMLTLEAGGRLDLTISGDTSNGIHIVTPSCNAQTASPELFYHFKVPAGRRYGYDIRTMEYDTVVMLMNGTCIETATVVNCNDDATPPGNLGSRIQGFVEEGDWYVMVDGYSSEDYGPFNMTVSFVDGCMPLCDGNFCGDDGCGGSCGSCGEGEKCEADNRCYPDPCTPQCGRRECGSDGCGGSCGECPSGAKCIGEGFQLIEDENDPNNGEVVSSTCFIFPVCNALDPICEGGCTDEQYCGRDCTCHALDEPLPDFVIVYEDLQQLYLEEREFPPSSCAVVENCVTGTGRRKLLRFSSSGVNQGGADFNPAGDLLPKDRPDIYDWGQCHGHWHYSRFMQYFLVDKDDRSKVVKEGIKSAYCLEDSRRALNGSTINCQRKYDCGMQGSQRGWLDSYGWSLDCSWMDVTDVPAGEYILVVEVNPDRVFPEMSYNNNQGEVRVVLPEVFPLDRPVHMLEWIMPADKNTSEAEGPSSAGQNTSEANPPPGSSAATTTVNYAGIFMSLFAWLVMMLGATM